MNNKQIVLGLGIVAAGVALLLANTEVGQAQQIMRDWWPVFVIGAGLYSWWVNPRNYVWSLIVIIVGSLLLVRTLGQVDINMFAVIWPIILVGIGANIISNAGMSSNKFEGKGDKPVAVLGGSSSVDVSDDYKGGSATAVLGGVNLDLSKAKIKKEATLSVNVFMGGLELRVPDDVIVKNRTTAMLGGFEDKTKPVKGKSAPVLYIEGSIAMGGVEVKR